ncbi:alpha/beta-hydrolase [Lindgomyces ingoldianus]|uniref:Alpha/beta-hydrolase n=1 Tax=Lindgomyces ingoldianus TaxID=673940 RepID=A0ACB6RAG4_9PLEO|nr:alpha/beta-hydrolase [Lindgomyces ingoldianus]KAF2476299.1 alpha/beta-hydrolase [Lindgomyces ingoldianus]
MKAWQKQIRDIRSKTAFKIKFPLTCCVGCLSPVRIPESSLGTWCKHRPLHSTPISDTGYHRVIAPDYRDAGQSSKPLEGCEKSQMAGGFYLLIYSHLGIKQKVHVAGHDIGGMIAYSYASHYANEVATLIAGHEKIYMKNFFDKQSYNSNVITPEDLGHYVLAYSQSGAMRAAFNVYCACKKDREVNQAWATKYGKSKVSAHGLVGRRFLLALHIEDMLKAMHEDSKVVTIDGSGRYVAEVNIGTFVDAVFEFVGKLEA